MPGKINKMLLFLKILLYKLKLGRIFLFLFSLIAGQFPAPNLSCFQHPRLLVLVDNIVY